MANLKIRAGSKLWYARVDQLSRRWRDDRPNHRGPIPHDVLRDHMLIADNERVWARGEEPPCH